MTDASRALGEPQLAGTWVNPKGAAAKLVSSVAGGQAAGAVGSFAAARLAGRSSTPAPETPTFGRNAYLAVGDRDLALVKVKQGLMKLKVTDEVLARAPRSDVSHAEVGKGKLACPLIISFQDGGRWEFDVPRAGRSAAERIVASLAG